MGWNRDLKKATEAYWGGKLSQDELIAEGKRLRLEHWKIQKNAGVDIIPSNDFAFYDQVLDHIQLFGVRILGVNFTKYVSLALTMPRPSRKNTPDTSSAPLMSILPWVVVCKSQPRMMRRQ